MSIVLLGLIGKYWAIGYVLVDLGLYFLVKLLRRDFWYWINAGNFEIIVSFMARLQAKVINDFTSIVQGRHPNEVGGAYWSFGLVMTMGTLVRSDKERSDELPMLALGTKAARFSTFVQDKPPLRQLSPNPFRDSIRSS